MLTSSAANTKGIMSSKCDFCGKTSVDVKSCTRCWRVKYCDKQCQKQHWQVHKLVCKPNESGGDSRLKAVTAKKENIEKCCSHCGKSSTALMSCTRCWQVAYCDKTCQQEHWGLHKVECKAGQRQSHEVSSEDTAHTDQNVNDFCHHYGQKLSTLISQTGRPREKYCTICLRQQMTTARVGGNVAPVQSVKVNEPNASDNLPTYNPSDASSRKIWFIYRHAATFSETDFRESLTKNGLDVNLEDERGSTALHVAAKEGNEKAAETLLASGADINKKMIQSGSELTALMIAASRGNMGCLRVFIRHDASVDGVNKDGANALMFAAGFGQVDAVRFLLEKGASVNHVSSSRDTALIHSAGSFSWILYRDIMVGTSNDSFTQPEIYNVSTEVILRKQTDVLKLLLKSGADANLQNRCGETALINLFRDSSLPKMGACPKAEQSRACSILISHLADVKLCDDNGMTALMHAARSNSVDCCKLMLGQNADVNQVDRKGMTALMHAAGAGSSDSCSILVDFGGHLNLQDKDGKTAFVHYIQSYPHKVDDMPQVFLHQGQDIQDRDGKTALMYAATYNHGSICARLVQSWTKFAVNTQDNEGRTALMHAIIHDSSACFHPLTWSKSDVNLQDTDGRTALMYALLHDSSVRLVLIGLGNCARHVQDKSGRTAANYAADKTCFDTLLLQGVKMGSDVNAHCPMFVLLLKDIRHRYFIHGSRGLLTRYKRLNQLLRDSTTRLLEPSHRLLLHELIPSYHGEETFRMKTFIENDLKHMIQTFVLNGVVEPSPYMWYNEYDLSALLLALTRKHVSIAKYFIANGYIRQYDMWKMRGILDRHHLWNSNSECQTLLQEAISQPWPLVKLAFIAVSTMLGAGPDRERRILETQLPARLQRCLMFQEPVSLLPVKEWATLELCFDPEKYEKLPTPRPLLYYWPFGRDF